MVALALRRARRQGNQGPLSGKNPSVPCQCHRPSNLGGAYDTAVEMAQHHGARIDGIGFVFTLQDPFCGIDLDDRYPRDAAECAPWAEGILGRFADTYSEQSPSSCGVKIWCRARPPRCGRWTLDVTRDAAIEIYDRGRYFAVTGRHAGTLSIADHQHDLDRLVENLEDGRGRMLSRLAIDGAIPQGRRHPTLVSLADTMWRRGMDAEPPHRTRR
jgi:hypothetical protein